MLQAAQTAIRPVIPIFPVEAAGDREAGPAPEGHAGDEEAREGMCPPVPEEDRELELPEEEVARSRPVPTPHAPTQAEIDLHRISRLPAHGVLSVWRALDESGRTKRLRMSG